ncbi:MAG: ATP-binding protein [Parachlamydiales bacterium]
MPRIQVDQLLDPEWDALWTLLIGPRRAGKTTLGRWLAKRLLEGGRFSELLYLNCDYLSIRQWLTSPTFIAEAMETFSLKRPILFIDEVQRLKSPGLLLKAIIDLALPIKLIATGSSQLEIRSHVQEFLTGRQLSSLILPLSYQERGDYPLDQALIYGAYPQVVLSKKKEMQIGQIYERYIQKDIVEILKLGHPDIFQTLLGLLAHSSGQLVHQNQLAADCRVSTSMIQNHLDVLEQTFVLAKVTPFVGNKRTEITRTPIYYFLDNGFRNTALRNYAPPENRADLGFLVESLVFQELYKHITQRYLPFTLHYWRTKSGAEVDFVAYQNADNLLPIEVKYQRFDRPTVSRGFRSFIEAYHPKMGVIVTRDFVGRTQIDGCDVHFVPLTQLESVLRLLAAA